MRKFILFIVLLLVFSFLVPPLSVNALDLKLFRIASAEDLLTLAENCRLDSYSENLLVTLIKDIDLSGMDFPGIPSFSGSFDGRGHVICGLSVTAEGSVRGLFRYLTETALVEDLHVQGTLMPAGTAASVGGIVGINAGTVIHCSFTGTVSAADTVGGIAGVNTMTGILEACTVNGTVRGSHFAGGIAGQNAGVIRKCSNLAAVNTTHEQNQISLEDITLDAITGTESAAAVTDVGGICGSSAGVIRQCVNSGNIGYPKLGYNIGGIAGSSSGYILKCVNEASIQGRKDVGGIVGQLVPAVDMLFEEDALQTLEEQMQTFSELANNTASQAQGAANQLTAQLGGITDEIDKVQDALGSLLPDENDPSLPDPDSIQAAQNALSGSISTISVILGNAGTAAQNSASALAQSINALSSQMNAISETLNTAKENIGGSMQDISDADTDADTTAKLFKCSNLGDVTGDWNIGGITGSVGFENSLDPESDLALSGSLSANFDVNFRAVIRSCENRASISGSKQQVGGIVGLATLGLIKDSLAYGTIAGAGAEYVGGIAGRSLGYIRSSLARCAVTADRSCGGIAGEGTTVTDCRSLVKLTCNQKGGAILGYAEDRSTVTGNYYLWVDHDPGAIDGISYADHAFALNAEDFFALPGLPEDFDRVTVTFRFDDGSTKAIGMPYGFTLNPARIPALPHREGFESAWEGGIDLAVPLYFDTEFVAVYTAHSTVLSSDLLAPNGHPRMLIQGDFLPGQKLALAMAADPDALYCWNFTLPDSSKPVTLRLLPPEAVRNTDLIVQLQQNGQWVEIPHTTDGSYLVFSPMAEVQAVRLVEAEKDYRLHILIGCSIVLIAVFITVLILARKKKKKTP